MDLEIKDQNIENYTTISVKDYIETILQGFCDQCGKNIPQEHGLEGVFWCPEHHEIKQAEVKCSDCHSSLKPDLDYYLINKEISQHRKAYLLCDCSNRYNELWFTFYQISDTSITEGDDSIAVMDFHGHKWTHDMQNPYLISEGSEGKLIKIPKRHPSKLIPDEIYLLGEYLKSKVSHTRQQMWYNKLLTDTIELGVKIETLHPLLCQQHGSYIRPLNLPLQNSIRQIIEHNPTYFYELISQNFETISIAIRRILGGKGDYDSGKKNNTPSITIYTFNKEFTQCKNVEKGIDNYTKKHKNFHRKIINKAIAHCDEAEYKSRKTNNHQDFMISVARDHTKDLCNIYNDYILNSIEALNKAQNLDIKLPYKITYSSLVGLSSEARQKLTSLLWNTDQILTRTRASSHVTYDVP